MLIGDHLHLAKNHSLSLGSQVTLSLRYILNQRIVPVSLEKLFSLTEAAASGGICIEPFEGG